MKELSVAIHSKIVQYAEQGDLLVEKKEYKAALLNYEAAYDLLPDPKSIWEASTWLLTAIGDVYFLTKEFNAGVQTLNLAMHCPKAIGNPFIHLRLGQCQFEIGDFKRAANELVRTYALEGEWIFEEEDSKYLEFLKTRIDG